VVSVVVGGRVGGWGFKASLNKAFTVADELLDSLDEVLLLSHQGQELIVKDLEGLIPLELDCHVGLQVAEGHLPVLEFLHLNPVRFAFMGLGPPKPRFKLAVFNAPT
jgi:hypothetical protein